MCLPPRPPPLTVFGARGGRIVGGVRRCDRRRERRSWGERSERRRRVASARGTARPRATNAKRRGVARGVAIRSCELSEDGALRGTAVVVDVVEGSRGRKVSARGQPDAPFMYVVSRVNWRQGPHPTDVVCCRRRRCCQGRDRGCGRTKSRVVGQCAREGRAGRIYRRVSDGRRALPGCRLSSVSLVSSPSTLVGSLCLVVVRGVLRGQGGRARRNGRRRGLRFCPPLGMTRLDEGARGPPLRRLAQLDSPSLPSLPPEPPLLNSSSLSLSLARRLPQMSFLKKVVKEVKSVKSPAKDSKASSKAAQPAAASPPPTPSSANGKPQQQQQQPAPAAGKPTSIAIPTTPKDGGAAAPKESGGRTPRTPADEGIAFFEGAVGKAEGPIQVWQLDLEPDGSPTQQKSVRVPRPLGASCSLSLSRCCCSCAPELIVIVLRFVWPAPYSTSGCRRRTRTPTSSASRSSPARPRPGTASSSPTSPSMAASLSATAGPSASECSGASGCDSSCPES